MRWGTQGSSRVLAGNSAFSWVAMGILGKLLSSIKGIKPPFEFWEGTLDFSQGTAGENDLISCWGGNIMVFLELRQEACGSSRVVMGTSGNLSCCLREVKSPFELPGGAWDCSRVTAGDSGLISYCGGNLVVFLKLWREYWGSSWVAASTQGTSHGASGKSGLLSSCDGHLRISVQVLQGNTASCRVDAGNSGFLSSCDWHRGVPIKFQQGSQALSCQPSLSITNSQNLHSCPLSQWCHPPIASSVVPISCLQSFPASGSFLMSQFFTAGSQNIGVSASASVLPTNVQDWFPLGWTGGISLQSKGLSRVFSNTTVQKHQFFSVQVFL